MKYLIWCHERNMWWMANRLGYSPVVDEAGRYSKKEAEDICKQANIAQVEETMVPENEAVDYQERLYA